MVRILSQSDVEDVLSLEELLPVVENAFVKQGRGEVERPTRPHFGIGIGVDGWDGPNPQGTSLTMPAYVHGDDTYATKLASVNEGNADRDLPTVMAQVVLTDALDGQPLAFMHGNRITNARTGCIGGLAARDLANAPVDLGVIGAGTQARWQTRAIDAATDLERVRVYSHSDSRFACTEDLGERLDADVEAVDSPESAVDGANVVATTTTATEPVFPGSALEPGALVVAIGAFESHMRELDAETIARADQLYGDVPEEAAETGDILNTDIEAEDLTPLSDVFEGRAGRRDEDEIIVLESVGNAVLDAASARLVYETADANDVGTVVEF
ncbi:ornithine cyclodeaminase family protein [Haloarculaceae archaeon H-GB2-1]|nr:ornithine cyclodeaminase family protein [Haloarculaceae archaeon H-GB1-1]MEA5387809.1 ornithine cyclodeaminase family protein [Haloarculaceae archaeon H-GB11]MEA5409308.1 ornithine cyclodeaminase family protein [Haloarculaceae archaeon H-GB2-1]